jgi:LysR family transcriptional activator of mexEF-oprN operon
MDLNLLVAFEALYRERSVTKAGRRLGLSQPATSAVLAKLRVLLGDPLFVKTPRGLEPTERCESLAEPVRRALDDLRDALGHEPFEPTTADRVFRIGAVDAAIAVVIPGLIARVERSAPHLVLDVRSIDPGNAIALLDAREIELALTPIANVPRHVASRDLFPLTFVLCMRPGHPIAAAPTASQIAAYPHVVVVFAGLARTPIDEALEATGVRRHVSVVVGSFLAVPEILADSDALAVLPSPYANKLARSGRIRTAPLPAALAQPARQMRMAWPARLDPSRAWRWLRDEIAVAARERAGRGA